MTGNTYLEMKLPKNPFSKAFATTTKTLGKWQISKNFPIRKSTSQFNLIALNTSKFGAKSVLNGLQSVLGTT